MALRYDEFGFVDFVDERRQKWFPEDCERQQLVGGVAITSKGQAPS